MQEVIVIQKSCLGCLLCEVEYTGLWNQHIECDNASTEPEHITLLPSPVREKTLFITVSTLSFHVTFY